MPVTKETLAEIALSEEEYARIVVLLGREPNPVELGMFGALWSEHCGYKNSRPLLKLFPMEGERVLVRAGEENAGAIDIGDGRAVVMKIESHNHPSAIEPYEGAATGVGGIVRDIFAMGAFPIALMNSLRFGSLSDPRNRYLFQGVVSGISGYGNCLGIPNVGGEVVFADGYSGNPLVNAMCVGLLEPGRRLVRAQAGEPGNLLILVGADTGRDGIHGASGLASTTDPTAKELRSAVQVGNPFLEKLLIEACLELAMHDWLVGMQDLGAAGLTSAVTECAARSGRGYELDVLQAPRRAAGMTPYEVMLSESQERMLVVVRPGDEGRVQAIFAKWDLHAAVIGRTTDDGMARIKEGDRVVAEVPIAALTTPPQYRRQGVKPLGMEDLQVYNISALPDLAEGLERVEREPVPGLRQPCTDAEDLLLRLLAAPNIASKAAVYRQYDHQVLDNTVIPPGHDAAVLRVKGTRRGLALTTDGNGRLCFLDPYQGGMIAVAEAARNLSCVGATPIALTDCLNFGNPERPQVYYQLEECISGMAAACRALGVPVVSGNVSLYNETGGAAISPTPIVGMLGLLEDVERRCGMGFRDAGDLIVLLGNSVTGSNLEGNPDLVYDPDDVDPWHLGGSEYLSLIHHLVAGRPRLDLEAEVRLQRVVREAVQQGIVKSAHDCSDGGLAVALAESCVAGGVGIAEWVAPVAGRVDGVLFGERQSRAVVSLAPDRLPALEELAQREGVPFDLLGTVGGDRLRIGDYVDLPLSRIREVWSTALERALG
ncbi:MAG: phosphoribosylformylglycinamidine synthase subunit PurL [Chloroflexi bacterium]|nr:phosphoribosylformylglycinamidine synthase subunit PurL [Chloroflexota bacterium]